MSRPSFTRLAATQFPKFHQETNHPESDAFEDIAAGKLLRNAMLLVEVHHIICLTSFVKLPQITRTILYTQVQTDSLILYITHHTTCQARWWAVSTASKASSSSFTAWQVQRHLRLTFMIKCWVHSQPGPQTLRCIVHTVCKKMNIHIYIYIYI